MKTSLLILSCLLASLPCAFALDCTPLVVSPNISDLNFGSVAKGSSKTIALSLRNDASRLSPISDQFQFNFTQSGVNSSAVIVDPAAPIRIPPGGGTLTVKITVPAGTTLGEISPTNSLFSMVRTELVAGNKTLCQMHVSAKIVEPLSFIPSTGLSFANVATGTSKSLPLTIKANASVIIDSIVPNPGEYSISGLNRFPFTLEEGKTQDLSVRVAPTTTTASGVLVGTLRFSLESLERQKLNSSPTFNLVTTVTAPAPTQPDLIPQFVGSPTVIPPQQGQPKSTVTFQLKVSNPGSPSLLSEGKVFLDDVLQKTITINPIATGSSIQQEVSFLTNKHGSHQLKVEVDTNGANQESNENNNVLGPAPINLP